MTTLTAPQQGEPFLIQRLVIFVLAGLLIFYHSTMLYDFENSHDPASGAIYNGVQGVLRVAIIVSLTLVVVGKRIGLWMMWPSIGSLIATHYWAHFGMVEADFTAGRHVLSYLKGLIFPSIITAMFLYRRR